MGVLPSALRCRDVTNRDSSLLASSRCNTSVADALVFKKIRQRLGGNIRYLVSGSAALSSEVAEWFEAAGLLILEGYGLTETSAGTALNRPHNWRFGTVGEPLPGIGDADRR